MKHVLHVIETGGPGGAETVFLELAAGLDRSRFASTCAVVYEGWLSATLRARGIEPVIVPTRQGAMDLPFLHALMNLIRRQRVDIVQSHLFGANFYSALAGRLLGVPVFSTFHGTVDLGTGGWAARIKMRGVTAGSRRIVFVSEALRRALSASAPVPAERSIVIHNGIDTAVFAPADRGARAALGLADDAVMVLAVGNIRRPKAYDTLLKVAAATAAVNNLQFFVAGDEAPALMPDLRTLARVLGVESRVRFLGFRDDVAPLLNACDIYLSTSRSEGFSLTTVQAMACEKPVIATRSGGPEEIVTHGHDGLLLPVDDVMGLANAVRDLAVDPDRRARLGAEARRTAVARFSIRRMVQDYAALYDTAG